MALKNGKPFIRPKDIGKILQGGRKGTSTVVAATVPLGFFRRMFIYNKIRANFYYSNVIACFSER